MPKLNSNYKVVHIMQVTDVKVKIMHSEGNLKAYASVTFDDEFVVKDIKVIDGKNGLFIAMPSRKTATGGYRDIVHPINPETRKDFEDAILEAYKKED